MVLGKMFSLLNVNRLGGFYSPSSSSAPLSMMNMMMIRGRSSCGSKFTPLSAVGGNVVGRGTSPFMKSEGGQLVPGGEGMKRKTCLLDPMALSKGTILQHGSRRHYDSSVNDWKHLRGYQYVTLLNDNNLEKFISSNDSVLIMFYAPWCFHCKSAKPEFAEAAEMLSNEMPSAKLAAIDCIMYPSIYEKHEVVGYPTIKLYRGGSLIGEYHHKRKASHFVHFMLRNPGSKRDL